MNQHQFYSSSNEIIETSGINLSIFQLAPTSFASSVKLNIFCPHTLIFQPCSTESYFTSLIKSFHQLNLNSSGLYKKMATAWTEPETRQSWGSKGNQRTTFDSPVETGSCENRKASVFRNFIFFLKERNLSREKRAFKFLVRIQITKGLEGLLKHD